MQTSENLTQEANAVSAKVARTVSRAAGGAHATIDRASNAAHPAVDRLAAGAHHAVDSIDDTATRTAKAVETTALKWRDTQSRVAERYYDRVRHRPIATLGIAIAAGFLLALLMPRR